MIKDATTLSQVREIVEEYRDKGLPPLEPDAQFDIEPLFRVCIVRDLCTTFDRRFPDYNFLKRLSDNPTLETLCDCLESSQ
jgi:hypothetical protein